MNVTIVELPEFIRRVERVLTVNEKDDLLYFLSTHPTAGVILQGTGGIRKIRGRQGKGTRGGVRVIYFFHDETIPLFLLTLFAKGEKANLSKAERNELAKLTKTLRLQYKRS